MNADQKKRLEQMNHPINALSEAVALADFYNNHQAKAAQQALTGTKDLINAVLDFIYHQPQRSDNFEQYEKMLEALSALGYRYCEGCDRWMSTTKERDHLKHYPALCDECTTEAEQTERATSKQQSIEAETETIDRMQREQQIEADTIEDIKQSIEQGDIEAFLENKYSDRPNRYHLSE